MEEVRYYNSPITLEEAEQYIQSGLITAARAYVANGYYLHRIREDKLFEEAGYQNFEDYVRGKYYKDKGWASKCIKVNQQLSEGGDSPILSKQYLEYSTYQLVELAYMSEEQREEADPDMTVNQLKQIRKPEEVVELEKSCDVTTFELEVKEQDQEEPQASGVCHFLDKNESIDDAYGWIWSEMVKEYLKKGYKSQDKEYEAMVFGNVHKVLKRENVTVFYNNSGETLFDVENTRLEREYNFFFGKKAEPESKEPEEEQEDIPQLGFYNPDDDSLVDESYSLASFPRASDRHVTMFARLFVQENIGLLFHSGVFYGISDEEIIRMLKLRYHARKENPIIIDNDIEVAVCAEIIEFSRGDEDLGICLFQKFSNYVRKQIDEYIKDQLAREDHEVVQEQQPEKKQGSSTFNSTPTSCPHREGYSCTVLVENKSIPGDGSKCGSSCCWTCKFQGMCKYECNASAGRNGEIPEYDAAWFVREWARWATSGEFKRVLEACRRVPTNTERAKAVQEEISPYGAYSRSGWAYEFSFHNLSKGIDLRIGKVDIHMKYGRFVQELMTLYHDSEKYEDVPEESETVINTPKTVPEQPESVPETPETVIDGEFVELILPEQETIKAILEEEKQELQDWLKAFEADGVEAWPLFIERQKIIIAALEAMAEDQEQPESESEPEPVRPEQPELPMLKNNDQRAAFVDAYETWPLWIETKETGERYYRYNLPDGTSIVVKIYHARIFDYHIPGSYEDKYKEGWGEPEYYLLKDGKFFRNCRTSRPDLIEKLKELQKKGKGENHVEN